jgi:hypothetical protein
MTERKSKGERELYHSPQHFNEEKGFPKFKILSEREQWESQPLKLNFFIFLNFLNFELKAKISLHPSSNGEDPLSFN